MNLKNDFQVLRDLAKRTVEIAKSDVYSQRREMWSDFNSLRVRKTPIYLLDPQCPWRELFDEKDLRCEHPLLRHYENWMQIQLYHDTVGDDNVIEPYVTVTPEFSNTTPHWFTWGLNIWGDMERVHETMAFHLPDPQIITMDDLSKLVAPKGIVDREKSDEKFSLIQEAFDGVMDVVWDNNPRGVHDLSHKMMYMMGPTELLYRFYDAPEVVHAVVKLITDFSQHLVDDAVEKGLYSNASNTFLSTSFIQSMTYCREIPSPHDPYQIVNPNQHWIWDHAQEFQSIGHEMFNEYIIEYMKPIYERFALTAFGCCEDLTKKIPYLKRVKNLRRVAVTPWADIEGCAAQLEDKYVISWRPNPAEMVTNGFDEDRITRIVKNAKEIFDRYGCYWEVNLKDILTVENDKDRLRKWAEVVRRVVED